MHFMVQHKKSFVKYCMENSIDLDETDSWLSICSKLVAWSGERKMLNLIDKVITITSIIIVTVATVIIVKAWYIVSYNLHMIK